MLRSGLVRTGAIDLIVVDSVAALTPRAEIQGDMGDSHMGLQARLMNQALRKLTAVIAKTKTIVIFINQLRPAVCVCSLQHLLQNDSGISTPMHRNVA